MTKCKEVVIAKFEEVNGTEILITSVDGHTGQAPGMFEAIQKLVCDKYAEDWKEENAIRRIAFKDLVVKYNITRAPGVELPVGYPGGVYEAIVIKGSQPALVLTQYQAAQGWPSGTIYTFTGTLGDRKATVARGNVASALLDLFIELGCEFERGRAIEWLISEFNVQLDERLDRTLVCDKALKDLLICIDDNTPIKKEKKVTKQKEQRIKLNIIDIEPNAVKDWVFTIDGTGIYGEEIPRTKFIVTSPDNSNNSVRTNPRIVIAAVLPSICSLTDDQLIALRTGEPSKFIENIDWTSEVKRGFPKNNAGAVILNFLSEIEDAGKGDILDALVEFMFNRELKWDAEMQLQRNMTGTTREGAECRFSVVHAVGNFYIDGAIELRKIRIFKDHSTVQIYTTPNTHNFDKETNCKTFTINEPKNVLTYLRGISEVQTRSSK
ncbi:hypothetical protein YUBABA_00770 [Serratia phage vB_SmaM-Yubaba]|nr:hypothetical protein YUBABA_00770 [Serratia phage vB_SmaM-Yubaba]